MIEVSNLVKKYGDHTAVDHLSFQIEKGKIYGFLGPNGAGKSTTMNMITGYIASTEGKVMIDGHDILGYPEVIILDEPTVGLDPKQIIEIRDLIKSLKKKHTVILSSHILSEVRAVCDYVLIISHGKLVASDTPDNLERLAAGSNSLLMKVKGEKDTIRKNLETIEGVTGVEMSCDTDEELWKTKVSIEENVDIREEVFYAMAKADCPIYEMQVKRVSLEDVFLELTEGEKKSSASKKKSQWKPIEDEHKDEETKSEETEKASDEKEGDQS